MPANPRGPQALLARKADLRAALRGSRNIDEFRAAKVAKLREAAGADNADARQRRRRAPEQDADKTALFIPGALAEEDDDEPMDSGATTLFQLPDDD